MLNLIVDQYLSFAELQARQRKPMYMADWVRKLDAFLKLNEREILTNAGTISAKLSEEIATKEFQRYLAEQERLEGIIKPVPQLEGQVTSISAKRKPKKSPK